MPKPVVTTSWDDGHILDLKLAELLQAHGLQGTFYIAPANREFPAEKRLTSAQIRDLSSRFEIGAHTLTHPVLTDIPEDEAEREIVGSKLSLERIIGRPVRSFCAPRGAYNQSHVRMFREAGFALARTVERFFLAVGDEPLEMPTTIHAYRHFSDLMPILKTARYNPMRASRYLMNWDELAMAMFDRALASDGVFHLWGHSWEIENNGDWKRVERVLKYISGRIGVSYLTNGELVQ
jgi:peptidoglycan/xylan/chitin deacetylase (PgdA/CDA1 family)